MTPENEKKADSAEEVLGIDENALDGQSKSIVTQFLENKKSNDSKAGEANEWDKDQKKQFGKEKNFGLGNERQNRNDGSLQPNSEEKNFGGPREELSLPQLWRDQHSPRAEKMREEKQVRMNEFQGLFKSQSVAPVPQGFNAQNNLNLQSGGSPSGSGVSFNRSAPTPYNSVKNPPRAPAGVSPLGLPNINTRVFGQSAAPIAVPEPVRSASQPAVLPLPKRRL
ncbi:MAG: hypothetical protein ABIR24_00565 [Verrucomicrobiota bacterium]